MDFSKTRELTILYCFG